MTKNGNRHTQSKTNEADDSVNWLGSMKGLWIDDLSESAGHRQGKARQGLATLQREGCRCPVDDERRAGARAVRSKGEDAIRLIEGDVVV
jgi:hypothetical protein